MSRESRVTLAVAVFAALLAVWIYWPAVHNQFLLWDDADYLKRAMLDRTFTFDRVRATVTSAYLSNYDPVTTLSHALDCRLWGLSPTPPHVANVLLHAVNVVLAAMFVWTLLTTGKVLNARERLAVTAGVALAFAIHPLQVESVAWVSERKTLLCTAFSLACLITYVRGRRGATLVLFALALLSKAMAAPLPVVMLLLDVYPLRRVACVGWRKLVGEKLPLIVMGLAIAAVAVWAQASWHSTMTLRQLSVPLRCLVAARAVMFYVGKLLWPAALSPYYPLDGPVSLRVLPFSLSLALSVTITILAIAWRRRCPTLFTAWFVYLALIIPTSGFIQAGAQAAADRYMYLAIMPLLLLLAGGCALAWRQFTALGRLGLLALLVCNFAFWGFRTRGQIFVWHDDEALWRAVLVQFPNCGLANAALARTLIAEGQIDEALEHAERAVRVAPWVGEAHGTLAFAYLMTHRYTEAEREAAWALRQDPIHAQTLLVLACSTARLGKLDAAYETLTKLVSFHPDYAAYLSQSDDLAGLRQDPEYAAKLQALIEAAK